MNAVLTRTWNDLACSIWPCATWVLGEGQFATIRGCGGKTTVLLHPTVEQARIALRNMHPGGTHGQCDQLHVLIELGVPRHE
jgi:hypothetical protein